MCAKVIGDTLKLSEYSNQRFLYGNVIPNTFGISLAVYIIIYALKIIPDSVTLIVILASLSIVGAFITNRISRFVMYFICRPLELYEDFLDSLPLISGTVTKYFDSQPKNVLDSKANRDRLNIILTRAILTDFKQIHRDSFYTPASTPEMEEIRRHETVYLLSCFLFAWTSIDLILAFALLTPNQIEILIFQRTTTLDTSVLIFTLFFVLMIGSIITLLYERNSIRNHSLDALPLYIKPLNLHQKAMAQAIDSILEKHPKNQKELENIKADLISKEFENEIRRKYRLYYIDQLARIRLRNEIDTIGVSDTQAEAITAIVMEIREIAITDSRNAIFTSGIRKIFSSKRFVLTLPIAIVGGLFLIDSFSNIIGIPINFDLKIYLGIGLILIIDIILYYPHISSIISRKRRMVITDFITNKKSIKEITAARKVSKREIRKILRLSKEMPKINLITPD